MGHLQLLPDDWLWEAWCGSRRPIWRSALPLLRIVVAPVERGAVGMKKAGKNPANAVMRFFTHPSKVPENAEIPVLPNESLRWQGPRGNLDVLVLLGCDFERPESGHCCQFSRSS